MDEVECGFQVHVDNHIPLLFAHAHHQAVAGDPGVIDQYVDATEILHDLSHHAGRIFEVCGVGGISFGLDAERLQLFFRVLEIFVHFQVGKDDRRALFGKPHGDCLPDSPGGSGHDSDFSFK